MSHRRPGRVRAGGGPRVTQVAVVAVAGGTAAGVLLGAVWAAWAPRVPLVVSAGGTYPQEYQPGGFIAADGRFAVLAVLAGLVVTCALLAWLRQPLAVLAAGVGTGVVGSLVAWWVGTRLGSVDLAEVAATAADGTVVAAGLRLRLPGVLLLWPATAALVATVGAAWQWAAQRRLSRSARPEPSAPP